VWLNVLTDRFCTQDYVATAGDVCACGDNLIACGTWEMAGCTPD
jgi:hypothetical protein